MEAGEGEDGASLQVERGLLDLRWVWNPQEQTDAVLGEQWLDSWFGAEAQGRLRAIVERLSAKSGR